MKKISRVILTVAGLSVLAAGWRTGEAPFVPTEVQAAAATADTSSTTVTSGARSGSTTQDGSAQATTSAPGATEPSSTATPTEAAASGTYVGSAISTRYGTMQVQLVVEAGVVTDIQTLQDGLTDSKSQRINANAIPTLISEVLDAQTSNVSYVSGASYTSQGILGSIEGALADAGLA